MKNKGLIITTIIFFLLVNSSSYWEVKLGSFAIPVTLLLVAVYFGLLFALLRQLFLTTKEKFKNKHRFFVIALLTVVLALTFVRPFGLINVDRLEGTDILVAQSEGAANCLTTFKLKENNKFTERSVCFGVTEIKGNYKLKNDTIYFENVQLGRNEERFYQFAVIKPSKFNTNKNAFDFVRYRDKNDTAGHKLWIIKNELNKPTGKSQTSNIGFVHNYK